MNKSSNFRDVQYVNVIQNCSALQPINLLNFKQAICGLTDLIHDLRTPVIKSEQEDKDWETLDVSEPEEEPQTWPESQKIITENFPSLTALLLLSYGSYVGVVAPLHQTGGTNSKSAFNFIPNRGATGLVPTK